MNKFLALAALLALAAGPALAQKKPAPNARPARSASTGPAAATLAAGKVVYVQNCLSCHQVDGLGVDGMNPSLRKTSWVLGAKPRLIGVLLHGLQGQDIDGEPYNNVMPAQATLTDQQVADVLTYVRNGFGNKASAVTVGEVKAARAAGK